MILKLKQEIKTEVAVRALCQNTLKSNQFIVAGRYGQVEIYEKSILGDFQKIKSFVFTDNKNWPICVNTLTSLSDGSFVVSGEDGLSKVFFLDDNLEIFEDSLPLITGEDGFLSPVYACDAEIYSENIATADDNGQIHIIQKESYIEFLEKQIIKNRDKDSIYSLCYLNENILIAGGEKGIIYFYETKKYTLIKTIDCECSIYDIKKVNDKSFAVGGKDGLALYVSKKNNDFTIETLKITSNTLFESISVLNEEFVFFIGGSGEFFCYDIKTKKINLVEGGEKIVVTSLILENNFLVVAGEGFVNIYEINKK
jgi:WD40 repeat protein